MDLKELYKWCSIPKKELAGRKDLKVPLRIVNDADELVIFTGCGRCRIESGHTY